MLNSHHLLLVRNNPQVEARAVHFARLINSFKQKKRKSSSAFLKNQYFDYLSFRGHIFLGCKCTQSSSCFLPFLRHGKKENNNSNNNDDNVYAFYFRNLKDSFICSFEYVQRVYTVRRFCIMYSNEEEKKG